MNIEQMAMDAGMRLRSYYEDYPYKRRWECHRLVPDVLFNRLAALVIEECAKTCRGSAERNRDGSDDEWQNGYNTACLELAEALRAKAKELEK